jgi:hypothetical protein
MPSWLEKQSKQAGAPLVQVRKQKACIKDDLIHPREKLMGISEDGLGIIT